MVPLLPVVGLRPPSKTTVFSHSALLSLLHLCLLLSRTQLQKAFSLNAGATKGVTSAAAQWVYGMVRCHEILIQRSFNVLFLTRFCHFRSISSSVSLSVAVWQIEELLVKMPSSSENWSESSFFQRKLTRFNRHFSATAQNLCCRFYSSLHLCLTISPRHNSKKAFSLNAGATKSWSSVLSLSCSWRMDLCVWSNYDLGGWVTRIIHFGLWVFSSFHHSDPTRNPHSGYQEPFISASTWGQAHIQRHIFCCHSNKACEFIAIDSAPNSLFSETESARSTEKIAELSP